MVTIAQLNSLTINGVKYDEFKPTIDKELSQDGKAADAKTVGDALGRQNLIDYDNPFRWQDNKYVGMGNVTVRGRSIVLDYKDTGDTYFHLRTPKALRAGEQYVLSFDCSGVPEDTQGKMFRWSVQGQESFDLYNGRIVVPFVRKSTLTYMVVRDSASDDIRPTADLVGDGIVLSNFCIEPGSFSAGYLPDPAEYRKATPTLTTAQKAEMRKLMDDYYNVRTTTFEYKYEVTHNAYASNYCWDKEWSLFKLCCATFVEMIWMGRSVTDFKGKTGSTYSNVINKAFDWGYMFQFPDRRHIGGVFRSNASGATGKDKYYKFEQPLGEGVDEYSYSVNSTYSAKRVGDPKFPNAQYMKSFTTANDMAKELYVMGCEIPFAELDVGDLVFFGNRWDSQVNDHLFIDATKFRGIGHVAMVYEITDSGVIRFIDCTGDNFVDGSNKYNTPILIADEEHSYMFQRARAINMLGNIVMCARHPAAWGKSNMAERERIDFIPMAYTDGLGMGRAIVLDFSNGDVTVEAGKWYVWDNHVCVVETSATVSAWDDIAFSERYE